MPPVLRITRTRGECQCQQRERIFPLVKAEDDAGGRIDEYPLDERWHVFSLAVVFASHTTASPARH
jgi:hypothetical protein